MNNKSQLNPFETAQKSTAIVTAWKSSDSRVKDQGVIYLGSRKSGHKALLGTIVSLSNVTYMGLSLKTDKFAGAKVELRISEEQAEELIDEITDMPERLIKFAVDVEDVSLKILTPNGVPTKSITFFVTITAIEGEKATLTGDTFDSQDALDAWGTGAVSDAVEATEEYRVGMQAVRAAAPNKDEAPVNALG